MQQYVAIQADVLEFLKGQPADAFDALLCDPPYGLKFMNRKWDYDVPSVETWAECLRVLKPGAPILAFGGSRTFHRIALGLEDAGAELCDTIMWVYGQGMPKPATTTDKYITRAFTGQWATGSAEFFDGVAKWSGYGHALRPSHEPIVLACKPYDGTIAENVLTHGVGALNVAACRLGGQVTINRWADGAKPFGGGAGHPYESTISEGRWPANVILSHAPECVHVGTREVRTGTAVKRHGAGAGTGASFGIAKPVGTPDAGYGEGGKETIEAWACVPWCPVRQMDEQSGVRPGGRPVPAETASSPGSLVAAFPKRQAFEGYKDTGGASRFFYHAKVNRKERERGCEHLPLRSAAEVTNRTEGLVGSDRPQAGAGRGSGARNFHPTLKPIDLTEYLARLAKPPTADAVLLVPFAGAGSEMIGALLAGWPAVLGIEREADYLPLLRSRVASWVPDARELT